MKYPNYKSNNRGGAEFCRYCGYSEEKRPLSNMTEYKPTQATLDCPNCDEKDGLEVESLKPIL